MLKQNKRLFLDFKVPLAVWFSHAKQSTLLIFPNHFAAVLVLRGKLVKQRFTNTAKPSQATPIVMLRWFELGVLWMKWNGSRKPVYRFGCEWGSTHTLTHDVVVEIVQVTVNDPTEQQNERKTDRQTLPESERRRSVCCVCWHKVYVAARGDVALRGRWLMMRRFFDESWLGRRCWRGTPFEKDLWFWGAVGVYINEIWHDLIVIW